MDKDLSTSVDQLLQLLKEKDSIKLSDAAKLLDTTKSHIESWSSMLEKEGIIKVHYSVIGGAVLQKGPNFNTMLEKKAPEVKEKAPAAEKETAPVAEKKAPAAEKETAPVAEKKAPAAEKETASAPAAQAPEEKPEEKPTPSKDITQKEPSSGDYLLIRKKIETGERYLEKDLEKLREEQQKVIAYLTALIDDSNKLTDYIEDLYKLVGDTKQSREERKPQITQSS